MASLSAECSTQPGDIWKQVNQFLKGGSHPSSHVSFESLSSSALFLLQSVPVARHAVLEHYANVFDDAVNTHLSVVEMGNHGTAGDVQESQLTALQDVTGVLLKFIKSNAEAWAPVVSSWSLSLLGQMSSKYATRRGIQHATNLNDILQMWMACPPAKMLIEITTDCFAAIVCYFHKYYYRVGGAPDMCVDSLLEASVRFSPHFDWVVAHIGSCFPTTIITRVLNCGLKDFCTTSREGADRDSMASRMKIPKMESVVGILGHLASRHGADIRKALMDLFHASLTSSTASTQSPSTPSQHHPVTTLPFLLQLASMSPMLLTILTTDLISALTPSVLNTINNEFTHWKRASPSEYNSFLNLVVHLMGKSMSGNFAIINFIMVAAIPDDKPPPGEETVSDDVRDTCREIMHILLFELQRGVMSRKMDGSVPDIPLLIGLSKQTDLLASSLLHSTGHRFECWLKLVTFAGLHTSEDIAASMLAYIVLYAETPQQLSTFYKLKTGLEMGFPSIVKSALVQIFQKLGSTPLPTSSTISSSTSSTTSSSPTIPASSSNSTKSSSLLSSVVSSSSSSSSPSVQRALKNLERIVTVEKSKLDKKTIKSSLIMCSVQKRHTTLMEYVLSDNQSACLYALNLMSMAGYPKDLDTALLTQLCGALVSAFFHSLHERSSSSSSPSSSLSLSTSQQADKNNRITPLCVDCIRQLSCFPFTKSLLIHYLVEGAVDKSNLYLFGGKTTLTSVPPSSSSSSCSVVDSTSLLDQNKAQNLSISLPRSHSSVFHGGVIQQSKPCLTSTKLLSKDQITCNRVTLMETLWECCKDVVHPHYPLSSIDPLLPPPYGDVGGVSKMDTATTDQSSRQEEAMDTATPSSSNTIQPTPATIPSSTKDDMSGTRNGVVMSESAARTLGCVLVDILTQDSLYNDVCWPDPDFRKVTTERDILVWKKLDELSFLWDVMQEFSSSCVFLYYLSPVLRSVTGTLMNTFEVCRERVMTSQPKHYEAAIKLVTCLRQGRLLPSPLYNISELFPFVSPYEGYLLLVTIWQFIKDNPPSEFESEINKRNCDPSHRQVLLSVIHANIDKMGHLCPRILEM